MAELFTLLRTELDQIALHTIACWRDSKVIDDGCESLEQQAGT